MSVTAHLADVLMDRLAQLDRAESLLAQTRVYNFAGPLRDNIARHRHAVSEARGHINAARHV